MYLVNTYIYIGGNGDSNAIGIGGSYVRIRSMDFLNTFKDSVPIGTLRNRFLA